MFAKRAATAEIPARSSDRRRKPRAMSKRDAPGFSLRARRAEHRRGPHARSDERAKRPGRKRFSHVDENGKALSDRARHSTLRGGPGLFVELRSPMEFVSRSAAR